MPFGSMVFVGGRGVPARYCRTLMENLFGKSLVSPISNGKMFKSQGPASTQVKHLNAQFLNHNGK